jgi:hypothetical protein
MTRQVRASNCWRNTSSLAGIRISYCFTVVARTDHLSWMPLHLILIHLLLRTYPLISCTGMARLRPQSWRPSVLLPGRYSTARTPLAAWPWTTHPSLNPGARSYDTHSGGHRDRIDIHEQAGSCPMHCQQWCVHVCNTEVRVHGPAARVTWAVQCTGGYTAWWGCCAPVLKSRTRHERHAGHFFPELGQERSTCWQ